ncbi:hypothetical protein [Taklimakanibacter albus]|uniref:Uncharacterized protein n=1 Tax=Taklimakanibacter albus TaxID=2800327 RepID=A0ACC5R5R7_9HYPH|nr:hypothetical protein [Aestuariivirga sp. YIM B02566]MBK1867846.1 hypothetical protein [Aestuariivirga sp. YIM B02566]
MTNERPEALAQFAESARHGEQAGVTGPTATARTAPIPTDPKLKDEAATRVLAEGATGEDLAAEEYVDRLPDRIIESQKPSHEDASTPASEVPLPSYDATHDARTGRPPQPLVAKQLAREHEVSRLSDGNKSAGEESHFSDEPHSPQGPNEDGLVGGQTPGRMISPKLDEESEPGDPEIVR